jgi:hypothetical protein
MPQVKAVIEQRVEALRCCYDILQPSGPASEGRVNVAWTIESSGEVSDYRTVESSINDQRLFDCMGETICGWRFPPPEQPPQLVRWSFLLKL